MNSETKNIVLVDDHVLVRNGIKELIEKLGSYRISNEYNDGEELLNALRHIAPPDLILMDVYMPVKRGDEVMEVFKEKEIRIPVLFLTLDDDENTMIRLFRLGARGYLRKNCTAEVLRAALYQVFSHGFYHNEFLTQSLQAASSPGKKSEAEEILSQMTDRERQFMKWVCHPDELTYEQIAGKMGIQLRTVDGYRESVFQKFGIKSKTGLVLFVLKHRLMDSL